MSDVAYRPAPWCAPSDEPRYPRYFVTIGAKSVEQRFELFVKPQTGPYLCLASVPVEHDECVITAPDHAYSRDGIENEDTFITVETPFKVTVMPDKYADKEQLLMRSRQEGLEAYPIPLGRDEMEAENKKEQGPAPSESIDEEMIGDDHHHRHNEHSFYYSDDSSDSDDEHHSDDEAHHGHHGDEDHFVATDYRYFMAAEQQSGTVAMVKFGHVVDDDHNELALRFHSFRVLVPWGEQADHFFRHENVHALAAQNRIMHASIEAGYGLYDHELVDEDINSEQHIGDEQQLIGASPVKAVRKKVNKVTSKFKKPKLGRASPKKIFKNPVSTAAKAKKPSLTSRLRSKLPARKPKAPKSAGQKMALAKGRPSNFSRLKQNVRQRVDRVRGKKPTSTAKTGPPSKSASGKGAPKYDAGRSSSNPSKVRPVARDRAKVSLVEESKKQTAVKEKRPGKSAPKNKGASGTSSTTTTTTTTNTAVSTGGASTSTSSNTNASATTATSSTAGKQATPSGTYQKSATRPRQFGQGGNAGGGGAAQSRTPPSGGSGGGGAYWEQGGGGGGGGGAAAARPAAPSAGPAQSAPFAPVRTQTRPTGSLPATPKAAAAAPQAGAGGAASAGAGGAAKAPPRRFGDDRPIAAQKPAAGAAQDAKKPLPPRHGNDLKPASAQQKNPATGAAWKRGSQQQNRPYWDQPGMNPRPGEYGYGDRSGPALGTAAAASKNPQLGPVAPKPPASSVPSSVSPAVNNNRPSAPASSVSPPAAPAPQPAPPASFGGSSVGGGASLPQSQQSQPTKIKIVNNAPSDSSSGGKSGKGSSKPPKDSSSSSSADSGKPSLSERLKSKLPSSSGSGSSGGGSAGGSPVDGSSLSSGGSAGSSGSMMPMTSQDSSFSQGGGGGGYQQPQSGFAGSGPGAQTGRQQGGLQQQQQQAQGAGSPGSQFANPPPGVLAVPMAAGTIPPGTVMTTNGLMQVGPNGQYVPASQDQLAQMAALQGQQQQQQQRMPGAGNATPPATPVQPGAASSSRPTAADFGPNESRVADDDESLAAVGDVGPPRGKTARVNETLDADERLTRQERAFKNIILQHENVFGKKPTQAQKERLRLRIASISPPFTMVKVIGQYMEWQLNDTGLRYT